MEAMALTGGDVERPLVISARSFSKTFSGRQVLRMANLDIARGEVHGLLGQNGSGKSTFIKILAGFHAPDPGATLTVLGRPVPMPVTDAQRHGLSFVHQDLALVDTMSVLENMRLRRYQTGWGWRIRWRSERTRVREIVARFGIELDPDAEVGTLRDVDRALVAILRALDRLESSTEGLLVLDEPTPYLPRDGVDKLLKRYDGSPKLDLGSSSSPTGWRRSGLSATR